MPFYPDYPVAHLRPAPYNPRRSAEPAFLALRESIASLGMLKPIIVADTGMIIAGHQRLKALTANGVTTTPAFVITELNKQDEMKFNQLHNGTDLDSGDEQETVPPSAVTGYVDVPCALVNGNPHAAGGPLRHTICGLLTLYGPWGGIVATKSGKCLSGAQYALSCKLVNLPVRVYYVEDTAAMQVRAIFQKQYGTFSYTHLPKTTYAQTFAQMYRTRTDKNGTPRGVKAPNYEKIYIPGFQPGERILDFGCGQGDYVRLLQERGGRIWELNTFAPPGAVMPTDPDPTAALARVVAPIRVEAAEAGTPINALRDAGGWANFDTPSRYVERAKVANAGVRLTRLPHVAPEEDGADG